MSEGPGSLLGFDPGASKAGVEEVGILYLLHFDPPVEHASHYVGYTTKTAEERFAEHHGHDGSPLVRAALAQGSTVELVRIWPGTRRDERALKDRKNSRELCPKCCEAYRKVCAERMRRIRQNKKDRARRFAEWAGAKS